MMDDELDAGYRRKVGERIRTIRRQKRLSLQDVEARSDAEFKASVLGAYERGQRLARFYSVPVDQMLPSDGETDLGISSPAGDAPVWVPGQKIIIDLTRLAEASGPEAEMINRYLTIIQVKRQDFNGRVLTIRRDDLQALAAILGTGVDGAAPRLDELGLLYRPATD